jgi:N-sulfoglucosamine sulfohydrolase
MEELRYRMLTKLKEEQDPRALGNGAIFDTYQYLGGRTKGYETWLKAQEERLQEMAKAGAFEPKARPKGGKKK